MHLITVKVILIKECFNVHLIKSYKSNQVTYYTELLHVGLVFTDLGDKIRHKSL